MLPSKLWTESSKDEDEHKALSSKSVDDVDEANESEWPGYSSEAEAEHEEMGESWICFWVEGEWCKLARGKAGDGNGDTGNSLMRFGEC